MIAVIGCGKAKRDGRHRARDLYTGNIFRAHLKLAEALRPRAIYVASAKYRLIGIDDEIESYDLTLAELGRGEMGDWRREIASRIDEIAGIRELVVVLAGAPYASWIDSCHRRAVQPLGGMMSGERLAFVARTVGPAARRGALRRTERLCDALLKTPRERGRRVRQVKVPLQMPLRLPLRPGESVARCFYFCCDGCGWRTDCWVQACENCTHRGCQRVDTGGGGS